MNDLRCGPPGSRPRFDVIVDGARGARRRSMAKAVRQDSTTKGRGRTKTGTRRRARVRLLLGFVSAAVLAFGTKAVLAAITAQTGPAGALAIANAMAAAPGIVTGAAFVTTTGADTTPNGTSDAPLTQFPTKGATFGILTSGNVTNVDNPGLFTDVQNGGGAIRGVTDRDVTILRIDLLAPPASNCLTFDFKFLSEEFPFYVGSGFNDAFIAELDISDWATPSGVGNPINAPHNFAFDSSNHVVSVNSTGLGGMTPAQGAGTAFDGGGSTTVAPPGGGSAGGATGLLSASKQVAPGPHSLFLSIFDQG